MGKQTDRVEEKSDVSTPVRFAGRVSPPPATSVSRTRLFSSLACFYFFSPFIRRTPLHVTRRRRGRLGLITTTSTAKTVGSALDRRLRGPRVAAAPPRNRWCRLPCVRADAAAGDTTSSRRSARRSRRNVYFRFSPLPLPPTPRNHVFRSVRRTTNATPSDMSAVFFVLFFFFFGFVFNCCGLEPATYDD